MEIKSLIFLKTVVPSAPTMLSRYNDNTVTNPYDIANTFNNYFVSIAETTKNNTKYLHKHFSDLRNILGMSVIAQYFCDLLVKKA